ncbi:MAG TPA: MFS transporter [Gemmatimonadaceae bacterium]|nr:MFS transporter [Gemmatimonadaceae bacterium]
MNAIAILQIAFGVILGFVGLVGVAAATGNEAALRWLHGVVDVKPNEVRAMLAGCLYFFCALASYFILRPIRDAMAVASGARNLPYLFAATLISMLVFHPIYSSLVGRFPVRKFVGFTYGFFAACLIGFFVARHAGVNEIWTGRVFFIWTSVFALYNTSIFWSVMVDAFHQTQAKRLFGFIAVGGTIGSVSGTAITALFVKTVGNTNLLLVSAALLMVAAFMVSTFPVVPRVEGESASSVSRDRDKIVGGSMWSGILSLTRSWYILGIAGFLLLYTSGSTVLYSAQTDIIGKFYTTRDAQTAVLANMELIVQIVAGLGQAFITARAIRTLGLSFTLSAVPIVSVLGFAALGATSWGVLPLLWTFLVFNTLRRASDFMLSNPSRKILFTVLSREDKYKSSSFLETSIYRLGDQLAVWGYAGLVSLGLVMTSIAWVSVPVSLLFLALSLWLAHRQRQLASAQPASA